MGGTSRISREAYVRICERLGVQVPGPTRPGAAMPRPTHLILGFQYQTDADRFLEKLRERLGKFGLELHQKRRAGSSSAGLPKRTGNVEEKGNPRRSISWASSISAGRTGMGGSRCDARRSASACERSYDRLSKSSARVCTIPYLKLANGSNRSCRATSTTMRYQETSTALRCSDSDCWDCGGAGCDAGARSIRSRGLARWR
jgi:hypothetical protein